MRRQPPSLRLLGYTPPRLALQQAPKSWRRSCRQGSAGAGVISCPPPLPFRFAQGQRRRAAGTESAVSPRRRLGPLRHRVCGDVGRGRGVRCRRRNVSPASPPLRSRQHRAGAGTRWSRARRAVLRILHRPRTWQRRSRPARRREVVRLDVDGRHPRAVIARARRPGQRRSRRTCPCRSRRPRASNRRRRSRAGRASPTSAP